MTIAIVDYGVGNLTSVKKAFDRVSGEAVVTSDPGLVAAAEKVVLPGVGHFSSTRNLDPGLRAAIAGSIARGAPFLGICVGMQWMVESSQEAPGVMGLGIWAAQCERFPVAVKSPHVGWNQLQFSSPGSKLLAGIPAGSFVYFTHSYRVPLLPSTVAECEYGGRFSAAVERENLFGVQFHPEKSGTTGLRLLENFCALEKFSPQT